MRQYKLSLIHNVICLCKDPKYSRGCYSCGWYSTQQGGVFTCSIVGECKLLNTTSTMFYIKIRPMKLK